MKRNSKSFGRTIGRFETLENRDLLAAGVVEIKNLYIAPANMVPGAENLLADISVQPEQGFHLLNEIVFIPAYNYDGVPLDTNTVSYSAKRMDGKVVATATPNPITKAVDLVMEEPLAWASPEEPLELQIFAQTKHGQLGLQPFQDRHAPGGSDLLRCPREPGYSHLHG